MGNLGGVATRAQASHGQAQSLELTLPPLAAIWLQPETDAGDRG